MKCEKSENGFGVKKERDVNNKTEIYFMYSTLHIQVDIFLLSKYYILGF